MTKKPIINKNVENSCTDIPCDKEFTFNHAYLRNSTILSNSAEILDLINSYGGYLSVRNSGNKITFTMGLKRLIYGI